MGLFDSIGSFLNMAYTVGTAIWNFALVLIGMTAAETPQSFSILTWRYVIYNLWPITAGIGAVLLNLSFFIGYMRQASNLKQDYTAEIFVESAIKVVAGNYLLLNGQTLIKLFFTIASSLAGSILTGTTITFTQNSSDTSSTVFYILFGGIYIMVCLVCAGMVFLTMYGRYLQLYLLAATAPIAFGTLPGGPGMSQTAFAWIRTFLAKVFEIVLIVIVIVIASKMCNAIDFNSLNEMISDSLDGAVQALQNMATMVLLAATVKGMDVFMRRSLAL